MSNERRKPYPFDQIEPKWQAIWEERQLFSCAQSRRERFRSGEAEILRPRHVSVPERGGVARWTSGGLHRDGHRCSLQTDARLQRVASDGLGRIRSARRAIRRQERAASRRHHARERREIQKPTKADRFFLRLATRDQHDRPALLQVDAVDFSPDLQFVVQSGDETGRADFNVSRELIPTAFGSLTSLKSR